MPPLPLRCHPHCNPHRRPRRLARRTALVPALLPLLLPTLLSAQGTAEDYRRARELPGRYRAAVRGATLEHTWVSATELIFRRHTAAESWEYLVIDASTGALAPAFDATALRVLLGEDAPPPDRLPVEGFVGTPGGWALSIAGRTFTVEREGGTLAPMEATAEATAKAPWRLPRARPGARSRDLGGETHLIVENRRATPIGLRWVERDGALRDYGEIAPGEQTRQHTYVGHVFEITAGGEPIGRYRAERSRWIVRIDEGAGGEPPPRRGPRPDPPERARSPLEVRDHDLYWVDRESGERTLLDGSGEPGDHYTDRIFPSPTGAHAIVLRRVPGTEREVTIVESSPRDQLQPRASRFSYRKPGDDVDQLRPVWVDLSTREVRAIECGPIENAWSIGRFHWTADGAEFRFLFNERGHRRLRVIGIAAPTGTMRVIHEERSETFIDYSQKTLLRWWPDDSAFLWMSERSGHNHLYRVEVGDGTMTPITAGEWVVRAVEAIDFDAGTVELRGLGVHPGQDPYHVHHGRARLDGSGVTWWTEGDGTHEISFSPDRRYIVDTWSRVDLPPVHELRRTLDGERVAELARADISALEALGWRAPERFVAPGRDGETEIWGFLLLPSNFDPTRRYPVVEQIYAGPHGHHVPKEFRPWHGARATAELGFIVGQVDGMGTNWRSKAFHDHCWQDIGDAGFPDRVAWWRAAARTRPHLDLSRVGIYGGSAGGQNAMRALIAHSDFYRVAVADCGCHDNRMDKIWWNEAWMGWPIGPHYEASSNVTQAHRMEGSLLLIVGELDRNVDPASTMQVVDALIRADKDFDLVVIPGAGHGAAGTPYGRRRQADFLVRELWGVEPRRE